MFSFEMSSHCLPQSPWIEAMLLEIGAANVTTLEYNEIESKVDKISVIGKLAN